MITVTNPKAIAFLLGEDAIMQIQLDTVVKIEYDFLNKNIELFNSNDVCIGSYNLLPERRNALERYINL